MSILVNFRLLLQTYSRDMRAYYRISACSVCRSRHLSIQLRDRAFQEAHNGRYRQANQSWEDRESNKRRHFEYAQEIQGRFARTLRWIQSKIWQRRSQAFDRIKKLFLLFCLFYDLCLTEWAIDWLLESFVMAPRMGLTGVRNPFLLSWEINLCAFFISLSEYITHSLFWLK